MCSDATRLPFSQQKVVLIPWVPDVFLASGGDFRCWPKADTSSAVGRNREKKLDRNWHTGYGHKCI